MRKLLQFACVLILSASCHASVGLVQSTAGGFAGGTVASLATITTSAAGYSGSTTVGSLLCLVLYMTSNTGGVANNNPAVSGGYGGSWTSGTMGPSAISDDGGNNNGATVIYWIANAPSMSPSQTTTVQGINAGLISGTVKIEFTLYEFNGVANPIVTELSGNGVTNDENAGGTPTVPFGLTTANTDLILVALIAAPGGSNLTAGSGYTLGINATTATVGQLEYQLNATPGKTSAAFTGSESFWGVTAMAFKAAPAGGGVIQRHRGSVF